MFTNNETYKVIALYPFSTDFVQHMHWDCDSLMLKKIKKRPSKTSLFHPYIHKNVLIDQSVLSLLRIHHEQRPKQQWNDSTRYT